jgi:hypothetical protein
MAKSKIGDYQFLTLQGLALTPTAEALKDITRANVHGQAWKKQGKRALPMVCEAIVDKTVATAATLTTNMRALIASDAVTIYDDFSTSMTNVKVVDVEPLPHTPITGAVGAVNADSTVLARYRVTMKATNV